MLFPLTCSFTWDFPATFEKTGSGKIHQLSSSWNQEAIAQRQAATCFRASSGTRTNGPEWIWRALNEAILS